MWIRRKNWSFPKNFIWKIFISQTEQLPGTDFILTVDRFCGDMEVMITVSSGTGRLMNWGSCIGEDAAPVDAPAVMIGSETFPAVTEPVLIEEDVVYARAGMQCIVYLKNDGSVWWQGRYEGTFHSGIVEQPSWARGWDAEDPFRMRAESPQKLLDDCIYVTTGNNTGAAITGEGELYT